MPKYLADQKSLDLPLGYQQDKIALAYWSRGTRFAYNALQFLPLPLFRSFVIL